MINGGTEMKGMAYEISLKGGFGENLERVIEALKEEGFGVLTRIDVHDAFKEKLEVEFRKYCILGACNPPLAHKALSSRPDAGLMLPCNVIVEDPEDGTTLVRIVDPAAMMQAGGLENDPVLQEVGAEAERRLKRVAGKLGG
jgi:uncharacterized protein (DUF302 family)